MSTEQLLQKRYRTKDYPNSPFSDGVYTEVEIKYMAEIDPEKYPNQFSIVQWWEEREEKDMPKYLKFRTNGKVRKVEHFNLFIEQIVFEGGRTRRLNKDWTPATESEYNEYLKQSK